VAALSLEVTEVSRLGGRRKFRQEFGLQISRKNELGVESEAVLFHHVHEVRHVQNEQ